MKENENGPMPVKDGKKSGCENRTWQPQNLKL